MKICDLKGNSHACVLLGSNGVSDVIGTPVSWKLGENAVWKVRERKKLVLLICLFYDSLVMNYTSLEEKKQCYYLYGMGTFTFKI